MAIDFDKLNTKFKQLNTELLSSLNDKVTIYHRPTVSGTAQGYSSYYGSSLDYDALLTISGFGDQSYTTRDVYGEIYLNVYGWQFSRSEELREMPIGNVQPGDVLFIGLPSNILLDSGAPNKGTHFDGCEFVLVDKDGNNYSVNGVIAGGLDDISYYYVLLRKSDVQQITYAS